MCCEPTSYHSLHTVCTKITPVRDYFHFKTDKTGEPMDSNEAITGRPPCSLKMNKQVRVTDAIKWSRNICDYSIYRLDGWWLRLCFTDRQCLPRVVVMRISPYVCVQVWYLTQCSKTTMLCYLAFGFSILIIYQVEYSKRQTTKLAK